MPPSVRFHPAALQEADEAAARYAERSVRAAVRFLDELDGPIDLIAVSPGRTALEVLGGVLEVGRYTR
jgi:hypothetical protein